MTCAIYSLSLDIDDVRCCAQRFIQTIERKSGQSIASVPNSLTMNAELIEMRLFIIKFNLFVHRLETIQKLDVWLWIFSLFEYSYIGKVFLYVFH